MTTNWQLRRVSDNEVDDDFEALELTDAFNRFARSAEVVLDDPDSVKTSEYPRGTLVELEVAVPGFFDFTRRFAGIVADYNQDRNSTSLTILSHDFWIRKRTVNRSFEQTRLETILQTLIEDLTPLSYVAGNVDLQSNPEISREWKGEQLEVVLDEIREISGGNESYGANNDLEFFMQQREFTSSPRNFGVGEYSNVEWSQDGKRDVNRAIVEYGEDDTAGVQIREDAQSQLDLQDKIGADDPVVIEQRKAYPEITDPDVAADKAKQLLNGKATLLTGEVDTWEAFAVTPGSVTDVVDPDTGTDGEFVVAEITYQWPAEEPETIVTVADRSVATSEELINLSDDVTRVDLRDTDSNAPVEQNIPTRIGALIDPTVLIGGLESASVRFTNTARNLLRDGWRGEGTLDITQIAVGDDNSNLSRTNTSLQNETNRAIVSESLDGSTIVEYENSLGTINTRELGLFDSSDNLLVRATFEAAQFDGINNDPFTVDEGETYTIGTGTTTIDEGSTQTVDEGDTFASDGQLQLAGVIENAGTVTASSGNTEIYGEINNAGTIQNAGVLRSNTVSSESKVVAEVSNNLENELGVLTNTGQASIRDILADNSPTLPQFYAYGSGDSPPQESDIALETELARQDLDKIVVQSANQTAQFEDITDIKSTDPVDISGDELTLHQTCFWIEGTDYESSDGTDTFVSEEFTGSSPDPCFGRAVLLENVGDTVTYQFTLDYDWPVEDWNIGVRFASSDSGIRVQTRLDGNTGTGVSGVTGGGTADDLFWFTSVFEDAENDAIIEAGTHTLEIELTENPDSGDAWVDSIAPHDTRFSYNFDNEVTCVDGVNYLDGPELYPSVFEVAFDDVSTRRDVTQANIDSTWDDVSTNQYLDLAIIDDSFERTNNSQTASISVSENDADTSIQSKVGLSRYGPTRDATPREGYLTQSISEWELTANPSAENPSGLGTIETLSVFPAGGDLSGTVLREAGQLTSDGNALTRSIFSDIPESGTLESSTTIIASEQTEVKQQ